MKTQSEIAQEKSKWKFTFIERADGCLIFIHKDNEHIGEIRMLEMDWDAIDMLKSLGIQNDLPANTRVNRVSR